MRRTRGGSRAGRTLIGCHTCGLVSVVPDAAHAHCPRCGSALHPRRRDSIARTWALSLAALILYLPANVYPVLTVIRLGAGQPSTILGGVRELISDGMWPLALLVFFASIAVPVLKLISLGVLLISTQRRSRWRLHDRTIALPRGRRHRALVDDRRVHDLDPGGAGAFRRAGDGQSRGRARSPSPPW